MQPTAFLDDAYALVQRDQAEEDRPLGQNVRDTFHLADFFIDGRSRQNVEQELGRVIEILFGHPFRTPTRDEHAMFLAEAAAMRSAEMGRQVGAVVATEDGDVIAVGTNEVSKPGGGLYWESDLGDARDFLQGEDTSDAMKRRVVGELLQRLIEESWLKPERHSASAEQMSEAIRGTRVASLIEFGRAVHAEMAALIDAARRGVAVDGGNLFVTTFPCHGCTRHIIAAGISRVIYIAPYSKSLAEALHADAIQLDPDQACGDAVRFEPFVGVAPRSYLDYFSMLPRKDNKGRAKEFKKRCAVPRLMAQEPDMPVPPYIQSELIALETLGETMESSELKLKE